MYVIGRAGRLQEFEKVLIGSFCFLLGMHHNLYRVNKLQVVIYSLTFLKNLSRNVRNEIPLPVVPPKRNI